MSDYTPEEIEQMESVSRRFNDWINDEIRQGNMRVDIMVELLGNLYIRLRTHLTLEEMISYLERTMNLLETKINNHALQTFLPDGTPIPFFSKEQQESRPGFLDMLQAADEGLSDEELARLLSE